MPLKIAVGGIQHETNTFQTIDVQLTDFKVERGTDIIQAHQGVRSYVGGMLDVATDLGATIVPTIHASTEPGGIISADAYTRLTDDLIAEIERSLPVDAVALALHGAGIARGVENIEVDICERVRQVVGPKIKIVVTLDLHGNLDSRLFDSVDAAFCVHNSPHDDMFERGQDAVALLPELVTGSINPKCYVERLPFLLAPITTMHGLASDVNSMCRSIEKERGMITCTFFHGFPYADSPNAGASILAISDGDAGQAREAAQRVGRFVWNARQEIRATALTTHEAIALARGEGEFPAVVLDGADNPGGGCPGDGTFLLEAMLEARLDNACYAAIRDPDVVVAAHRAGVGSTIEVKLGGKTDGMHGRPIPCVAYVKALTDGRFLRRSPENWGKQIDVGKTARLQINNIDVVVVSERHQVYEPEIFLIHGIDVARYQILGIKSTNKWRGGFAGIVKRDYLADSPGLMSQDLSRYSYKLVKRPTYPLDATVAY
ncbi:M81 family metallopeptidase [Paraburkholderia sp. EG286B]|uniref:M81 family metallopeptidase n=1 Tax=Paraburkholderia sp. EG286B TaxID=3237011 RepID=UPI0034D1FFBE